MKDLLAFKLLEISGTTITVAGILMGITFLVLGLWLSKRVHFLIRNKVAPRFNIDQSTGYAIGSLAYYLGTSFTVLFAISMIGFDLSNLALVAGALSVGVGLGLQTIANNFVSGLLLLFDRSMKVGDYVELADGTRGLITKILVRSTIIMTNDGVEVIVPNSHFLSDRIINWTLSDEARRMHIPFGVGYGSDVRTVMRVAQEAAASVPSVILDDPDRQPHVWFTEMADSSLNFELIAWVRKPATLKPRGTRSLFLCRVHQALLAHGIEIPFPQRDVHIKTFPTSLEKDLFSPQMVQ